MAVKKSNISTKEVSLTFGQLKDLTELLSKVVVEKGFGAEYSFMLVENYGILGKFYQQGMQRIYNPNNDMELQAFKKREQEIVAKYAEKNADGSVQIMNGQPVIVKNIAKFQSEMQNNQQAYASALQRAQTANQKNAEILNETYKLPLKVMPLDAFPIEATPIIVWAFSKERT